MFRKFVSVLLVGAISVSLAGCTIDVSANPDGTVDWRYKDLGPATGGDPYGTNVAVLVASAALIGTAAVNAAKKDKTQQASDMRLKTDIVQVATLENGLKLYRFKYLWDSTEHIGVLAQEVIADPRDSSAVTVGPNGFFMVDYAKLGLRLTTYESWKAKGIAAARLEPEVVR